MEYAIFNSHKSFVIPIEETELLRTSVFFTHKVHYITGNASTLNAHNLLKTYTPEIKLQYFPEYISLRCPELKAEELRKDIKNYIKLKKIKHKPKAVLLRYVAAKKLMDVIDDVFLRCNDNVLINNFSIELKNFLTETANTVISARSHLFSNANNVESSVHAVKVLSTGIFLPYVISVFPDIRRVKKIRIGEFRRDGKAGIKKKNYDVLEMPLFKIPSSKYFVYDQFVSVREVIMPELAGIHKRLMEMKEKCQRKQFSDETINSFNLKDYCDVIESERGFVQEAIDKNIYLEQSLLNYPEESKLKISVCFTSFGTLLGIINDLKITDDNTSLYVKQGFSEMNTLGNMTMFIMMSKIQ